MNSKNFTYTHSPDWMLTEERRAALTAAGMKMPWGDEKQHQGTVVMLPHPFGSHIVVSGFDGENITTFMVSGGHKAYAMVAEQKCDSPIETQTFDDPRLAWDAFLQSFPHKDGYRSMRVVVEETINAITDEANEAARQRHLERLAARAQQAADAS